MNAPGPSQPTHSVFVTTTTTVDEFSHVSAVPIFCTSSEFEPKRKSVISLALPIGSEEQLKHKKHGRLDFIKTKKGFSMVRHLLLILILVIYSMVGALIFYNIESGNELETLIVRRAELIETIHDSVEPLKQLVLSPNGTDDEIERHLKDLYVVLLEIDGKFGGSTFDKHPNEEDTPKLTWSIGSAFFFSVTVFSTIGYGAITPETYLGKVSVVIYAIICIPLTMVFVHDFGQLVLDGLNEGYTKLRNRITCCGHCETEEKKHIFPIPLCLFFSAFFIVFAGFLIYGIDRLAGPDEDALDVFHALYFSFISITTIGFGDVMPGNATFSPVVALLFFLSFPMMRALHRAAFLSIENRILHAFDPLDERKPDEGL